MSEDFKEQEIICIGCKETFIFTQKERDFMKRLHEEGKLDGVFTPKRCMKCRKKKREVRR